MSVHEFTITGRIPSKKNQRNIFICKGANPRLMNLPSNKYAAWHADAEAQIEKQFFACGPVLDIQMEWWLPDNRKCDLTNKAESVMDLFVDMGIIPDDCWQKVPRIMLEAKGVDMDNPRVHIWIREMNWIQKKIKRIVEWIK